MNPTPTAAVKAAYPDASDSEIVELVQLFDLLQSTTTPTRLTAAQEIRMRCFETLAAHMTRWQLGGLLGATIEAALVIEHGTITPGEPPTSDPAPDV